MTTQSPNDLVNYNAEELFSTADFKTMYSEEPACKMHPMGSSIVTGYSSIQESVALMDMMEQTLNNKGTDATKQKGLRV